jgi:hypothetical protein
VRGRFHMNDTHLRSTRVPAKRVYRGAKCDPIFRRHSREGGNPVLLFRCHPERSEGSGLATRKPSCTRLRARPWSRGLKLRFRLEGGSLSCLQRQESNQRNAAPMSAPSKHLSVFTRSPALLGQGGRFRQAIPGLSKTASASMPRPRLRAAVPPCPAMLGAARRGATSEAKATSKAKARIPIFVIPAKAGIQGFGVCISSFRIPAHAGMTTVEAP